jgi:hypothetical protein
MSSVATLAVPVPLSIDDQADLTRLERIVERGRVHFLEVAAALAEIKGRKLYKSTHRTWEAYCRERWGFSRSHSYRLIDAGRYCQEQAEAGLPAPKSEYAARQKIEHAARQARRSRQRLVPDPNELDPEDEPAPTPRNSRIEKIVNDLFELTRAHHRAERLNQILLDFLAELNAD